MHEKGEFPKIKGSVCKVPVETTWTCNILLRPGVFYGLFVFKLKGDL